MTTFQIDTNVLLRFFVQDSKAKAKEVDELFKKAAEGKVKIVVSEPVCIETAVTLKNYYKYPKDRIVEIIEILLTTEWIECENNVYITEALQYYVSSNLDFVDCLILSRAVKNDQKIFTFDQHLLGKNK